MFLIDGEPNGRMTCELSNWTGKAYKIPRNPYDFLLSLSATGVLFAQSSGKGKQNEVSLRSQTGTFSKGDIVRMIREKGFHHPYDQSSWQLSPTVRGNVQHEYVQKIEEGGVRPCLRSHVAAIRIIPNKELGGSP